MRTVPDPGFAGDDGAVDPDLAAELAAYDADPDAEDLRLAALARLQDTRVLVPVVAVLGESEPVPDRGRGQGPGGLVREKTSDMAAVLMQGQDGRTALLAFTGTAPLAAWDPAARPVPVGVPDAARAALQDGADALVLDVAGPVLLVVGSDELAALAAGERLLRVGSGWGWAGAGGRSDPTAPD